MRGFSLAVLLVLAITGCSGIPSSGPVHRVQASQSTVTTQLPNFAPPGPQPGADPESLAKGFLRSLTAVPFTTSVARKFMTNDAASSWKPDGGTIVYSAVRVTPTSSGVKLQLTVSQRLDGYGAWQPVLHPEQQITLDLTWEAGQWRISNPLNQLLVPEPYFIDGFQRLGLYFFDQTGRALVSVPVFLIRGEQLASELVRSLFAGPGDDVAEILHTEFPPATQVDDFSVVVSSRGVAQVPVSPDVLDLTGEQLNRAMAQLSWTLRQIDGVSSVSLLLDGAPLSAAGQENAIPVNDVEEYNALAGGSEIWALEDDRVVVLAEGKARAVAGPLGKQSQPWRSVAANERTHTAAVVTADGQELLLASTEKNQPGQPQPFLTGEDLLSPTFDALGNLWVVDRNRGRARVWLITNQGSRRVSIPGVSGSPVRAVSVSGEGARLAFLFDSDPTRIALVNLLRKPTGDFLGVGRMRVFRLPAPPGDSGQITQLGWRNSDTLVTMTVDRGVTRINYLGSDGSPADSGLITTMPLFRAGRWLAVSPDSALPMAIGDRDGQVSMLGTGGDWQVGASHLVAPTYSR